MAFSDQDLDLQARIKCVLLESRYPISYGALARDLDVPGPGAVARVTAALEALMRYDMAEGRPFVAALCEGKLSGGLPAFGFFEMAAALGRYTGPATGPEAAEFVLQQRKQLGWAVPFTN